MRRSMVDQPGPSSGPRDAWSRPVPTSRPSTESHTAGPLFRAGSVRRAHRHIGPWAVVGGADACVQRPALTRGDTMSQRRRRRHVLVLAVFPLALTARARTHARLTDRPLGSSCMSGASGWRSSSAPWTRPLREPRQTRHPGLHGSSQVSAPIRSSIGTTGARIGTTGARRARERRRCSYRSRMAAAR